MPPFLFCEVIVELRNYQAEAIEAYWEWLCTKPGNPLIVIPTGGGKSLIAATICRRSVKEFGTKVLVLTHVKELLSQNESELLPLVEGEGVSVGVYSAGLKRREHECDVVFAGIQSVCDKAELFQDFAHILIDEAHLVPSEGEGRYRKFLSEMRLYLPNLRVGGLTATPYRTTSGKLWGPKEIFQGVCYTANLPRLIADGYLCLIKNCAADASVDTSGLRVSRGEFIVTDQEFLFGSEDTVQANCLEIVQRCKDRRSVLVFCTGIQHAERVEAMLNNLGNGRAVFICGDSPDLDRFAAIAGFKAGAFKYLVNVNLLTTGFNARNCDAIAVLRATVSPGLFAQIVGRGLRTCPPEKKDCLLLDFGENLQRHGPIDSMHFGKKIHRDREGNERATGGGGGLKTCPNCEELCERMVRICECGFLFKTLSEKPDNESPILSESTPPKLVEFLVHSVSYSRHVKKGDSPSPPSLRVTYACHEQNVPSGNLWMHEKVDEWVCFEHEGFAKKKAADWWAKRSSKPIPGSIISVLAEIDSGAIIAPSRLWARKEGHWWRIDRVEFEDEKPSDQEGEDGWPPELETDYSQAEMPF